MIFDTHAHYDDEAFDRGPGSTDRFRSGSRRDRRGRQCRRGYAQARRRRLPWSWHKSIRFHLRGSRCPSEQTRRSLTNGTISICLNSVCSRHSPGRSLAIGEIGLDYYWEDAGSCRPRRNGSCRQLNLARELNNFQSSFTAATRRRIRCDIMKEEHSGAR